MQSHNHAVVGVGKLQPNSDGSPLQSQPSRKRERNDTYDEPNHDRSSGARNEPDESARTSKRSRHVRTGNASAVLQPRCLVVHRVQCEGGETHSRHKQVSHFFDAPRLFAGDSKASALRGNRIVLNIEEYLEDNPEISLVVYKTYSCNDYHEVIEEHFHRLELPKIDFDVIAHLRSYFFSLRHDAPQASFISEEITNLSDDLKEAMGTIELSRPEIMANWQDVRNLKAPYLHLYHCRRLIQELAPESLPVLQQEHARPLPFSALIEPTRLGIRLDTDSSRPQHTRPLKRNVLEDQSDLKALVKSQTAR